MTLKLRNLNPVIGSEVEKVDLSNASDELLAEVRTALGERKVLVFRNQVLTRDQHRALGRAFGTGARHTHALASKVNNGIPDDVFVVSTGPDSKFTAGEGWHTDVSCDKTPIAASMLYVTKTPESGGGDTLFTNMNAAYEGLSAPIKDLISGLKAFHDGAYPYKTIYGFDEPVKEYNSCSHPIVIKHPETGEPLLFVNRGFTTLIEGLSLVERRYLLEMLFSYIESTPRLQCRVAWEPNTLVMWDNLATQHHAAWDYFPETRYGERVSVVGFELEAAFPDAFTDS